MDKKSKSTENPPQSREDQATQFNTVNNPELLKKELDELLCLKRIYEEYLYNDYLDNDIYGYEKSIRDLDVKIAETRKQLSFYLSN